MGLLTERISQLCQQGISPKDIALISLHGLQKSAVTGVETLGDYRLSRFTGDYSADGKQQWTAGDIVMKSIYRSKGSQRPFIFMIDADFAKIAKRALQEKLAGPSVSGNCHQGLRPGMRYP